MYNPDTDLLFPARALSALRELRSPAWQDLLDSVIASGADSLEQMAFILMMARMNNCAACNADSCRALSGCTACSRQSIKRSRATDEELAAVYQAARNEVGVFLQKKASLSKNLSPTLRKTTHR